MLTSTNRILTTHTGSLPRPAALTELYAGRAEGEAIDEAALDAAGKAATRHVVRQQIAAGIDVGNNGEQQREAFFLYVRRRMSGFGGSWIRRPMADIVKYPGYPRLGGGTGQRPTLGQQSRRPAKSDRRGGLPRPCSGQGGVRRVPGDAVRGRGRLRRTVHDRAVAWHHRRRAAERTL